MRRVAAAVLLALLVTAGQAFSFSGESFRQTSTGGLIEDDFDLLFDPARLPEIDGSRIYTNLSNLVDQDEEVFNGFSEDVFLVGGSVHMGDDWSAGILYNRYYDKSPENTGLTDRDGLGLMGEGEKETSTFVDTDGDDVFDRLDATSETREAFRRSINQDFYAALARQYDDVRVGLAFFHTDGEFEQRYGGSNGNYDRLITSENLITGQLLSLDHLTGTDYEHNKFDRNGAYLSVWTDAAASDTKIGFRAGAARITDRSTTRDVATRYLDRSPALSDISTLTTSDTMLLRRPSKGWDYQGGATVFYDWSPQTQTRVYADWLHTTYDYEDDATQQDLSYSDDLMSLGSDLQETMADYFTGGPIAGDGTETSFDVLTYTRTELDENVTFAMGARFTSREADRTETFTSTTNDVDTFNDGDGVDDFDDFTTTTTSAQTLRRKYTSSEQSVSIPVGLEFKLRGPVMLRLGAIHTQTYTNETETDLQLSFSDEAVRTVRGDGTVTESLIPGTSSQVPGTSVTTKTYTSSTDYSYGLGVQVTENLQIDVMGFSDVTNLADWKLSAVLEFR